MQKKQQIEQKTNATLSTFQLHNNNSTHRRKNTNKKYAKTAEAPRTNNISSQKHRVFQANIQSDLAATQKQLDSSSNGRNRYGVTEKLYHKLTTIFRKGVDRFVIDILLLFVIIDMYLLLTFCVDYFFVGPSTPFPSERRRKQMLIRMFFSKNFSAFCFGWKKSISFISFPIVKKGTKHEYPSTDRPISQFSKKGCQIFFYKKKTLADLVVYTIQYISTLSIPSP